MVTPRRAGTIVALLAALAVLAPFFVLFAYAHPQNDDWVSAVSAARDGVLVATEGWLRSWGGRYSATLLNLLTPLNGGTIESWRVALAAYALAVPVGIWAVAAALAPRAWRGLEPLVVAAVLSALLFGGMPFAAGGLYWMNGSVCYGVGEGLALFAVAALLAGERPGARSPWGWAGAGALFAVTAAGMNEITALLVIGTLAVLVAAQAVGGRVSPRVALVLAAAIAGLVAVLLIPGTRIRLESGGPAGGRHLAPLALETVATAAGHAVRWCWTTPVLPAALLLALAAARARQRGSAWTLPHPGVVGPAAAMALFGTTFLPLYGQGTIPPHTLNLVHAVFVVGLVLVAASAGDWLGARRPGGVVRPWMPVAAWAAAAGLALLPGSAGRTAWSDLLTGRAARYDAALVARYALLQRCGSTCVVPRLEDPPATLSWFEDAIDEATETPFFRGYKDASYGRYFGKRRIRLAPP